MTLVSVSRIAARVLALLRRRGDPFRSAVPETLTSRGLDKESRLRRALERGELEVHYQPQVGFATGEITSVEALLRWNSPELGSVPPAQFIPLAEETGLIHPIGAWEIGRASCRERV